MAEESEILFSKRELAFLRALYAHKVKFLIVGLAAATLQGAPVVTHDIDLWFKNMSEQAIKEALKDVGGAFVPSFGMNPPGFAGAGVELFDLVTSMSGLPDFDAEYEAALSIQLGDFEVKVLPLARIILSKKTANRQKDKLVLPVLENVLKTIQ